ncbi:hypothetical protein [Flavobacterium sp. A45]|uniref:hypothetical protein n=1 Tax=Flavobacterium sp. A45 TaxID=1945862 RepID=UPI0009869D94|nr:hypothetical protein [Flavobacterium sp. A45]OOG77954.1 hypothetical protein B0E44_01810 [Flavobacterium sp. A45]
MKRNVTKLLLFTAIIFTFLLLISCEQDDNNNENKKDIIEQIEPCINLELKYILLDSSFKSIPYTKIDKKLHFIDSLNNEVVFEVVQRERKFYSTTGGEIKCPSDNSKKINVEAEVDNYSMWLVSDSDEVDIKFLISLQATLGLAKDYAFVYDRLDIIAFPKKESGNNISYIDIQVNQRENNYFSSSNNFYKPIDSINLKGKIFYNVYHNPWTVKGYMCYNYEFGLIAFKDSSGKLWILKTN